MKFYKTVFTIALPIIMQNFFSAFINMLDTIMVGQLGSIAISAVGLSNQIFFIMNIVIFGICSGGAIFIAQYWGKQDFSGLRKTLGIMILLSVTVSILFSFLAILFPEFCLRIYTKDQEVIKAGCAYLKRVGWCYIFIGLGYAWAHSSRSTEHVKLPMIASLVSVLLNCALNIIFIFGVTIQGVTIVQARGIIGAADATVIARFVEASILICVPFIKKYEVVGKFKEYFAWDKTFIEKYIKIALPVLLSETFWAIGFSLENSVLAHAGTAVIAAANIRSPIDDIIWTFFIGTGNAAAIIIGKKIGEKKYTEVKQFANRMARFMAISGGLISLLMIPISFLLPYFYKVEPEVIRMAQNMIYLYVLFYSFSAFDMCIIVGICRAGGDTTFSALIDIGFLWLISLPLAALGVGVFHWPYWLLIIILRFENVLKAICGFIRLRSGKWMRNVT